jgi:Icc-related predicted phosphoesterase
MRRWTLQATIGVTFLCATLPAWADPPPPDDDLPAAAPKARTDIPQSLPDWTAYQNQFRFECMGPIGPTLTKPFIAAAKNRSVEIRGYTAKELAPKAPGSVKLGIISTTKGFDGLTLWNLRQFIAIWRKEGVSAVLVGGDVGSNEGDIAAVLEVIAAADVPVYAISGNNDPRSQFNRAVLKAATAHPNVVNMNLVRFLDGDGFDLVSLPGYFNKAFAASNAVCVYKEADVGDLAQLTSLANDPVVLLAHGPPRDQGPSGIDRVSDGDNVGYPAINDVLKAEKIQFGVFGHIIEAGGVATKLDGKPIKPGAQSPQLYLNNGAASASPWTMNDGTVSTGMAATITITKAKKGPPTASYTIHRTAADAHKKLTEEDLSRLDDEADGLRK